MKKFDYITSLDEISFIVKNGVVDGYYTVIKTYNESYYVILYSDNCILGVRLKGFIRINNDFIRKHFSYNSKAERDPFDVECMFYTKDMENAYIGVKTDALIDKESHVIWERIEYTEVPLKKIKEFYKSDAIVFDNCKKEFDLINKLTLKQVESDLGVKHIKVKVD